MIVCDANVAIAWAVEPPWSGSARRYLDAQDELIAPDIFVVEVGNTLWKIVRAGTLMADEALQAYDLLLAHVTIRSTFDLRHDALTLAIRLRHAIYDCFYIALARRESAMLVTADRRLGAIAERAGVTVDPVGGG